MIRGYCDISIDHIDNLYHVRGAICVYEKEKLSCFLFVLFVLVVFNRGFYPPRVKIVFCKNETKKMSELCRENNDVRKLTKVMFYTG